MGNEESTQQQQFRERRVVAKRNAGSRAHIQTGPGRGKNHLRHIILANIGEKTKDE